jgi:hypothetical protein
MNLKAVGLEHNSPLYLLLVDEINRKAVKTTDVRMTAALNDVPPKLSVKIKISSAITEVMFCRT